MADENVRAKETPLIYPATCTEMKLFVFIKFSPRALQLCVDKSHEMARISPCEGD